jgi:hypothetical protein
LWAADVHICRQSLRPGASILDLTAQPPQNCGMDYRILADVIFVVHLGWIIFMIYGFILTVRGFWRPTFWDRWVFRSIHLLGILFVAGIEILGQYCPLTVWEYALRRHYNPGGQYPHSFIIGYLEKLVYPDVSPLVFLLPTYTIALFTLVMFVVKPPSKFWSWKK